MGGDEANLEWLVAQRALVQAAAQESRRRIRAGVYALSGNDRALAGVMDPELMACRTADAVAAYLLGPIEPPRSYDYIAAAAVLAWSMDSSGTYAALREAHDRAISEKQFHFAVGARERLGHHALLFGDVEIAREAIEDAMRLAIVHRLPSGLVFGSLDR